MHKFSRVRLLFLLVAGAALLAACTPKSVSTDEQAATDRTVYAESFGPDSPDETLDPELAADPKSDDSTLTEAEQTVLNSRFGLLFDLEPHESKEVEQYLKYFTHKARRTFERWLKRSEPYLPYVRKTLTRHGLPQDLVLLPFTESGYNPKAYSWAGAGGMWQFMPYTGRKYGLKVDWWIDERRDPYKATEAAAKYLKELHERFGDWYLALAAYNAGEGKISRALKKTNSDDFFELCKKNRRLSRRSRLRKETRHYVPKFIAISKIFQNLDMLGFEPVRWDQDKETVAVAIPGGTDLLALARAGKMSWREFHEMNPAFRRQVSPPDFKATAHLPVDRADKMMAYLANPSSRPYAGYVRYRIRSGDSWWRISRKFGVPISVLKKVNNRRSNTLRPGRYVMVPGRGSARAIASSGTSPIPTSGRYKVRRGDSWWTISRKFGVSINRLKSANNRRSNTLRIGQIVRIPGSKASASKKYASASTKKRAIAAKKGNYVVKRGDSLWSISKRYRISVSTLKSANGLGSSRLKPGMKLFIPDHSSAATRTAAKKAESAKAAQLVRYKVRRGDTLSKIARRFGVRISDLRRWNSLNRKGTIYAGQRLKVYVQ
ncbi:LysM peptidoglycan-binding domain-containing protein [Pseudodesulfovibrio senegalensis]|uniref:LysM peptidoglycan-binding domain-containing protein n=1 Tax=Pseudodesulfovibrio senegalensis TaxID=1721087 RepID=A0A6N6MZH7_9BACT|nr:LysM peptidoglycan-binding domain-containing protein [Pseudodesulfovibrio senegalensis]KAB1438999.1 LysM peptidoglycan-binding domain-containing protein [Pseudodesulfovibrio senegalensis]